MGWKEKEYRTAQKNRKKDEGRYHYDAEMLRIQGLIRCENCENPYPYLHRNCPVCDHPNHEKYALKNQVFIPVKGIGYYDQ